jgi:hypothetical protein
VLSGQLRGVERKGEKAWLNVPGKNRKDECK